MMMIAGEITTNIGEKEDFGEDKRGIDSFGLIVGLEGKKERKEE